jgi:hypothetical protein
MGKVKKCIKIHKDVLDTGKSLCEAINDDKNEKITKRHRVMSIILLSVQMSNYIYYIYIH